MNEEIFEYGTVKETHEGSAVIVLKDSNNCRECTAKIFCKSDDNKERELIVKDDIGVSAGTHVLISVSGSQLLGASFLLYGIPLLLFMSGILGGALLFTGNTEVYSALLGVILVVLYYLIFSSREKKKKRIISRIVSKIAD